MSATVVPRPTGLFRNALLTLMLVVLGLGLLYAYRAQAPSVQPVAYSEAVREINAGQVRKVTILPNRATLELQSGDKRQLNLPDRPEAFQKVLDDYNVANPSRPIIIEYQAESPSFSAIGSIFLSVLPVLLIGGFFFYMMRQAQRR